MAAASGKRHSRSRAVASSDAAISAAASSRIAAPAGKAATLAQALTLDADEIFVRMGVREVQSIEATLRATQDDLTARLRTLVSERYRDMLGTANTLIDLSGSSSKLVERINSVLEGVGRADSLGSGAHKSATLEAAGESSRALGGRDHALEDLSALVAVTRLLVEAPDEVWRSLEHARALQSSNFEESVQALNRSNGTKGKGRVAAGKQARTLAAAHILRAAYLFALASSAWAWLLEREYPRNEADPSTSTSHDMTQLFTYVAQQYKALAAMQSDLAAAASSGIEGWAEGSIGTHSKWSDFSTSDVALSSFMLSLALIDRQSTEDLLDRFERCRMAILRDRLKKATSARSSADVLAFVLQYVGDTVAQGSMLFAASGMEGKEETALFSLEQTTQCLQRDTAKATGRDFPPNAFDMLSTMPSADVLQGSLPGSVLDNAVIALTALTHAVVKERLSRWIEATFDESFSALQRDAATSLRTIKTVGKAQLSLKARLDRVSQQVVMVQHIPREHRATLKTHIVRLASHLDAILAARLQGICEQHREQLCAAVTHQVQQAIDELKGEDDVNHTRRHHVFARHDQLHGLDSPAVVTNSSVAGLVHYIDARIKNLCEEMASYLASWRTRHGVSSGAGQEELGHEQHEARDLVHFTESGVRQDVQAFFEQCILDIRQRLVQTLSLATDALLSASASDSAVAPLLFLSQLAGSMQAISAAANSAPSLQDIERKLLKGWAHTIINTATTCLAATSLSIQQDADAAQTSAQPSRKLLQALLALVEGLQVSCSRGTQANWLRRRLVEGFTQAWLQAVRQCRPSLELYIDAQILCALLERSDSTAFARLSDEDKRVSVSLDAFARQLAAESSLPADRDDIANAALARVRLLIVSLAVDEVAFVKRASLGAMPVYSTGLLPNAAPSASAQRSNTTNGSAGATPFAIVGFRPLPALHAVASS